MKLRSYVRTHVIGLVLFACALLLAILFPLSAPSLMALPFAFGTLLTEDDAIKYLIANGVLNSTGRTPVHSEEVTYTETAAGTYSGSVNVPAGATLLDIIVNGVALWTAATSAAMEVGDGTDPDGYFTAVDLKATDLLAGESISFALAGGKAGAYIANSQVSPRYAAAARVITGTIVSVGAGTAGRTRMTVVYSLPARTVTATKTA